MKKLAIGLLHILLVSITCMAQDHGECFTPPML